METLTKDIPENQLPARSPVNRPIGKSPICSAPNICQLETRPLGHGDRCVHSDMVRSPPETLCEPPVESDRQSPRHPTPTSHVGHIRERRQHSHLSGAATGLVLSSWRESHQNYMIPVSVNEQVGVMNGIEGPISDVANFLAELYDGGYQYRSFKFSYMRCVYCYQVHFLNGR